MTWLSRIGGVTLCCVVVWIDSWSLVTSTIRPQNLPVMHCPPAICMIMVWTEQNLRLLHETLCNCDDVPTIFKVMAQHGISAHRTRIAMHDINNQTMKWNVGTTAIFTAMWHQIRNSSDDVIISNITTGMAWYGINARKTQSKLASCGIHTEVYKERQRLIAAKQRLQTAITASDADMSYDVTIARHWHHPPANTMCSF